MPVEKRTYRNGREVWHYRFDAPGSTRENRKQITASGFETKKAAIEAEARRRIEVQHEHDRAKQSASPALTLDDLLASLFQSPLARKTLQRYQEMAAYLSADLRVSHNKQRLHGGLLP